MSFASRTTLLGSCVFTVGIIVYVHFKQESEREQLHLGVVRDMENQRLKKEENIKILLQQQDLTKQLREEASKNIG